MNLNNHNLPSLQAILTKHGVNLEKQGNRLRALCPLHKEKTPSFVVFLEGEKEKFHCFGCGANGDVLDFLCAVSGEPLSNILKNNRLLAGSDRKTIIACKREARKKLSKEKFNRWLSRSIDELCLLLRCCDFVLPDSYHHDKCVLSAKQNIWQYYYDILMFGDEQDQYSLYREYKHGF